MGLKIGDLKKDFYYHIPFLNVDIYENYVACLCYTEYMIYSSHTGKLLYSEINSDLIDCLKHYISQILNAEIDDTILNSMGVVYVPILPI